MVSQEKRNLKDTEIQRRYYKTDRDEKLMVGLRSKTKSRTMGTCSEVTEEARDRGKKETLGRRVAESLRPGQEAREAGWQAKAQK
jgi:hypothetical protein